LTKESIIEKASAEWANGLVAVNAVDTSFIVIVSIVRAS
jgi:hypothetical protein